MFDYAQANRSAVEYWERQPTDQPWLLNGFRGTWNFRDHDLIPNELFNFLREAFHPVERIKRIPLDAINAKMNEVWTGPGSMPKLMMLTAEMRAARLDGRSMSTPVVFDDEEVRTIDDFTEEDFAAKASDDDELETVSEEDKE